MRFLLQAFLLTAVAVCCSSIAVADLRPCNVSLFAESFVVVLGKYGITWVDGQQRSLKELNRKLDKKLNDVENHKEHKYALRRDTAKLFYSANYSHLIVAGISFDENKFLEFGVLDSRHLGESKYNGHRGWDDVIPADSQERRFCVRVPYSTWAGPSYFVEGSHSKWHSICESKSIVFIPTEHRFVFDVYKSISFEIFGDHPIYKSPEVKNISKFCQKDVFRAFYIDQIYPRQCKDMMPEQVPNEMIADLNGKMANIGNLFAERVNGNWTTDGAVFLNQLESGKLKLHAEIVTVNQTEFYYHVFTRFDRSSVLTEVEKCYIRKFKKEEVKDKYRRDDQPLEYPRMLVIPKQGGLKNLHAAKEANRSVNASRYEAPNNESSVNLFANSFVFGILFLVTFMC